MSDIGKMRAGIPCVHLPCTGTMRVFAEDTQYWYYICSTCKKERLVPKELVKKEARKP